jgi:hypothetical protein
MPLQQRPLFGTRTSESGFSAVFYFSRSRYQSYAFTQFHAVGHRQAPAFTTSRLNTPTRRHAEEKLLLG